MKKTGEKNCNVCCVTGKVASLDKIDCPEGKDDFLLMVETILPDGSKVCLPCGMEKSTLDSCKGKLREGDWISLLGILNGVSNEGEMKGAWIEAIALERETKRSGKKYCNEAMLTGTSIESGCLIDRGIPVAADFVLELESLRDGETFEAEAIVPQEAVQEYIDTLGCQKLKVLGALEFVPSEKGEEDAISMTVYVRRIYNAEEE